ncbi:MAG: hypothetical protein E6G92_02705 [Alphaproteobacteria bacterium]|nr:MAG: hypothetical protein E6G92_02705 [Alphaproteobacteria bacterium]
MALGENSAFLSSIAISPIDYRRFKLKDLLYTAVSLPFNMQHQTQSNWCWAATSTSTSLFYRPASTWTQCRVANSALALTTCCGSPVPGACNVAWYLDRALQVTQNFVSVSGPASFAAVQAEINAGRVLGARVGWAGGGGHFMVIYGCSTVGGVQYFNIDDPIYGKSNPSVATFSSSYQGSGTWTHTYFTKAGPPMVNIRIRELAPELLKRIWEVRPLLVPHGGDEAGGAAAGTASVSLGLAHPVQILGLSDLARAAGGAAAEVSYAAMAPEPSAIRVIETRDGEFGGFYDVSAGGGTPEVLQMASADNDYGRLFERGLAALSKQVDDDDSETDLRLLRIPALYTEAVVVGEGESAVAVPIRSPQEGVPLFEPMPLAELLARLEKPAREILDDDDELKGA